MEETVNFIDVHDLPDDEAQCIAAFVAFLRERRQGAAAVPERGRTPVPAPQYIHHVTVTGETMTTLRRLLADYDAAHPGVIRNHAVGHMGKAYMIYATEDLTPLLRDAGLPCSVTRR
jgi:hypothetical protein